MRSRRFPARQGAYIFVVSKIAVVFAFIASISAIFLHTISPVEALTSPSVLNGDEKTAEKESTPRSTSLEQGRVREAEEKNSEESHDQDELVKKWFDESALAFIRAHARDEFADVSSEDIAAIRVHPPKRTHEFSQVEKGSLTVVDSNMWVAPLALDTKVLGVLSLSFSSDQMNTPVAMRSVKLADALLREASAEQVVYDSVTQGWYAAGNDMIRALDTVSEGIIAGPVSFEQFQEIRKELQKAKKEDALSSDMEEKGVHSDGVLRKVVILAFVLLLVVIGVMMWNRSVDSEKKLAVVATHGPSGEEEKTPHESVSDPHMRGSGESGDNNSDSVGLSPQDDISDRTGPSERTIRSHTGEIVRVIEMPERKEGEAS